MSTFAILIKSWFYGISIAAIVGPMAILFIRKTLDLGKRGAWAVGLGISLADGLYGLVATMGFSVITAYLQRYEVYINLVGGLVLVYLAIEGLKNKKLVIANAKNKSYKMGRIIGEVFLLTMTNPSTIIVFTSFFATIGVFNSMFETVMVPLGILFGSATWWLILGVITLKLKRKLSDKGLRRITLYSAWILLIFGLVTICQSLRFCLGGIG